MSFLNQRELSKLEYCDKISKVFKNTKISKNFKIVFEILWHQSRKTNSQKIKPLNRLVLVAVESEGNLSVLRLTYSLQK